MSDIRYTGSYIQAFISAGQGLVPPGAALHFDSPAQNYIACNVDSQSFAPSSLLSPHSTTTNHIDPLYSQRDTVTDSFNEPVSTSVRNLKLFFRVKSVFLIIANSRTLIIFRQAQTMSMTILSCILSIHLVTEHIQVLVGTIKLYRPIPAVLIWIGHPMLHTQ